MNTEQYGLGPIPLPMEHGADHWDTATGKVSRGWALIRVHGTCAAKNLIAA